MIEKIKSDFKIKKEYQEKFEKELVKLNDEQLQAVEQIEGPVMVVAGPGTGKTQILSLRIANILNKIGAEFAPNILALTFTNAGVKAMRERLINFIGIELAYEINIFTFHSFAEDQIKNNSEYFSNFIFSCPIDQIDQIEIIEDILESGQYKKLKTFSSSFHSINDILKAILDLKSEAITIQDFEASFLTIEKRTIDSFDDPFYKRNCANGKKGDLRKEVLDKIQSEKEKQKELLDIYKKYQEELIKRKFYDFNDTILSVVEKAKNDINFRAILQEKYLYILVDEHQDTNEAQNKIIELIGEADANKKKPNIFTVGDEKQAIFRFQGADEKEFKKFKEKYVDVKIINLEKNYRSSQNILNTAHSLISDGVILKAENKNFAQHSKKVNSFFFEDRKEELIFLAEEIKEKIKEGVNPNEIAVFYSKNNEVDDIKNILEKYNIPYNIFSKENILDSIEIKKLLLILKAINNPYDDNILAKVLFIDFFDFDTFDILKIFDKLATRHRKAIKNKSVLKIISSKEILENIEISEIEKFLNFSKLLNKLKKESENLEFLEFFELALNEIGFLKYILSKKDNVSALKRLEKIFDEVKNLSQTKGTYSLKKFLRYIEILERESIKIEVGQSSLMNDGINLMTAHKSKGLEFEYVYITNFTEKNWDKSRNRNLFVLPIKKNKGSIDDKRRLFYVALTRGKKEVVISYAKKMDNLKRENLPSRFLKLIDENLIDFKNIKQKDLKSKIELYFGKKEEKVLSIFNKEFIKKTFLENPLSFTALNNYLKSPIVYFFRNLIRLPSVQVNYLVFGNIIHKTLELYFEKGKNEKRKPEKKELLLFFDQALEMFKINEKDFKNFKNRGYELLEKYFDKYNKDFNFDIRLEKDFYSEIELKDGAKLKLYGIVDKIEKLDDNKIRVIDYKTGKTYREKTKEGRENLERQLVFYRLLIDGYFNDDRVSEAVLDFVEENKKTGELEVFKKIIDKKDVEELKELIREFAEDILSGDFLEREYEKTKENKEYFELWELLRKTKN